ncbi:PREDICTED: protein lethal(2)essential for life-like [Papilio polytes]|uniref:protein lethal(2)essential for life-like n=1 Tax=Papilio polytes TaxID=76194 RepID=UPI000676A28D|nr:PREDICTED: protein lethal(2)essential for life-like [Papilio polytes]
MSMYPFFIEYERPRTRRLTDQHFGLGLTPQDYLTILAVPQANRDYYRPWRNLQASDRDEGSTIKEEKDKFQVNLDVQHFSPEEISVKTADGFLIVEAKHEEREDEHGFISRSFTRKYPLPEGIEAELVTSKLSSDGVLTVTAPLKAPPKNSDERIVPIIQTGPVKRQGEEEQT